MGEVEFSNMAKDAIMIDYLFREMAACYARMGAMLDQFNLMTEGSEDKPGDSFHAMAKEFQKSVEMHRDLIDSMNEKEAMMKFIGENDIMFGWRFKKEEESKS
jgi:hypothetical protein